MELRMWYTKMEFQKTKIELEYLKGTETPADKLTKLGNYSEHVDFANNIQGLNLLDYDYFNSLLLLDS
jgi:hypothetical protein